MSSAELLIDSNGPEIRHRTGIAIADEFIYLKEESGEELVFLSFLEFGFWERKLQFIGSTVKLVELSPYIALAKKRSEAYSVFERAVLSILDEKEIDTVFVSKHLPFGWAKVLQDAGKTVRIRDFAKDRSRKTEREIGCIKDAQRVNDGACAIAEDMLRRSTIDGDVVTLEGDVLTSERIKEAIKMHYLKHGYNWSHGMVVSSGEQSGNPHDEGEGPIHPHQFIVVDLFPQSDETGFFADMTRTFVKGAPTDAMRAQYEAVATVQNEILETIALGERCNDVHTRCIEAFKRFGFASTPTSGFMHCTGHGLGLEIHESPSLLPQYDDIIEPGMVFTVEPGLYYPETGGVRIEDIIVFHPDGRKENITHAPKEWIIP